MMPMDLNDTGRIINAIEKLEIKIDKNQEKLRMTLFGPDGTEGICGIVHKHDLVLMGINGTPGLNKTVEELKENQSMWNKWLAIAQGVAYGVLTYFGIKSQ